jgi:hypothetical protein
MLTPPTYDHYRDPALRVRVVDTPSGFVAVWDIALQARGYSVDDAGAYALAYDLIAGENV